MPHAAHGHLPLLHGFQKRGLRFGRRAVDFVGQDDVGEQRPFQEAELAVAAGAVLHDHVRAGDVRRRQVGRELDAAEAQVERAAQGADHQRLGQARHAFQQAVPAAEEADEQFLDDRRLADDDLAQLVHDLAAGVHRASRWRRSPGRDDLRSRDVMLQQLMQDARIGSHD